METTHFKRSLKSLDDASNNEQAICADPHAVVHPVYTLQQRAVHIHHQPLGRHTDSHMVPLSIWQTADWEPDRETDGTLYNHVFGFIRLEMNVHRNESMIQIQVYYKAIKKQMPVGMKRFLFHI